MACCHRWVGTCNVGVYAALSQHALQVVGDLEIARALCLHPLVQEGFGVIIALLLARWRSRCCSACEIVGAATACCWRLRRLLLLWPRLVGLALLFLLCLLRCPCHAPLFLALLCCHVFRRSAHLLLFVRGRRGLIVGSRGETSKCGEPTLGKARRDRRAHGLFLLFGLPPRPLLRLNRRPRRVRRLRRRLRRRCFLLAPALLDLCLRRTLLRHLLVLHTHADDLDRLLELIGQLRAQFFLLVRLEPLNPWVEPSCRGRRQLPGQHRSNLEFRSGKGPAVGVQRPCHLECAAPLSPPAPHTLRHRLHSVGALALLHQAVKLAHGLQGLRVGLGLQERLQRARRLPQAPQLAQGCVSVRGQPL